MGKVYHKSDKMDWGTPDSVYDPLNEEFRFEVDAACTTLDCKCPRGIAFDEGFDSLTEDWAKWNDPEQPGPFWLNPPYGREIGKWVQKAWDAKKQGVTTVCLVPARTDTKWWSIFWDHERHHTRSPHDEVRFVKGRIRFEGAPASAPFPSAIIVMRGEATRVWCPKCGSKVTKACHLGRTCGLNQDTYNER